MTTAINLVLDTPEAKQRVWRMSPTAWQTEQDTKAAEVALYRRYVAGEHDADLTDEMQEMLRISADNTKRFNDNYMDLIIQTEADRLAVEKFESDSDEANKQIAELVSLNRFDGMQTNVHQATLRDADSFVMVHWDEDSNAVKFTHEPAYDGTNGMLAVLAPDNSVQIAIKVWQSSIETLGDTTSVAVYYDDHVELYQGADSAVTLVSSDPYPLLKGAVIGQPVIHFKNRGVTYTGYGKSEIADAIPMQDSLNRTLHSMVSTSELTGFPIRYAVGMKKIDGALTPGMFLWIAENGLDKEAQWAIGTMEQGEIVPYIQQAEWLTTEMGRITRTPAPEFMGSSASSGEALKQRESGLLGKVRNFQVHAGNRWEDVMRMAWRVQAANSKPFAEFTMLKTIWKDPEIRNEVDIIANAKVLSDLGYQEEALRQMAGVFDWDEEKILKLAEEKQRAAVQDVNNFATTNTAPDFANVRGLTINNGGIT